MKQELGQTRRSKHFLKINCANNQMLIPANINNTNGLNLGRSGQLTDELCETRQKDDWHDQNCLYFSAAVGASEVFGWAAPWVHLLRFRIGHSAAVASHIWDARCESVKERWLHA